MTANKKNTTKLNDYPSITFKYVKAYEASGQNMINGLRSEYYHVTRPDSIRFSFDETLAKLLKAFHLYRRPKDYSSESGQYEIKAKYASQFLDALKQLQAIQNEKCVIEKQMLKKLIADLQDAGYLDKHAGKRYLKEIHAVHTLEQIRRDVDQKRDYVGAISLAWHYRDDIHNCFHVNVSLNYLCRAIEYKPEGCPTQSIIDLDDFLSVFKILESLAVFSCKDQAFQDALYKNNTITKLSCGIPSDKANVRLTNFIANSTSLKKIDIWVNPNSDSWERLDARSVKFIARGLEKSSSVEELILINQPIRDEGLHAILTALAKNPKLKLRKLNVAGTHLTAHGLKELEEFLLHYHSLQWVNVYYNADYKDRDKQEIIRLADRNELINCLDKVITANTSKVEAGSARLFDAARQPYLVNIHRVMTLLKEDKCTAEDAVHHIINIAREAGNEALVTQANGLLALAEDDHCKRFHRCK